MSELREAAQQALEALESLQGGCTDSNDGTVEAITVWCPEVIEALRAALADPVQEPVAWSWEHDGRVVNAFPFKPRADDPYWKDKGWTIRPLVYGDTAVPPQRKPLTDEEILDCWKQAYEPGRRDHDNAARLARAVEQAHGIGSKT